MTIPLSPIKSLVIAYDTPEEVREPEVGSISARAKLLLNATKILS